jgi:hypothetical protein
MPVSYREAVVTYSLTLPLSGYVGYRRLRKTQPIGVEADLNSIPRVAAAATLG